MGVHDPLPPLDDPVEPDELEAVMPLLVPPPESSPGGGAPPSSPGMTPPLLPLPLPELAPELDV
jgi:hypothetical protein